MHWFLAIPAFLGSAMAVNVLIAYLVDVFPEFNPNFLMSLWIFGTALWATFDSRRIELKKYESAISYGPVAAPCSREPSTLDIWCPMNWRIAQEPDRRRPTESSWVCSLWRRTARSEASE